MNSKANNRILTNALASVQSATRSMVTLNESIEGDSLFHHTVGDELSYEEIDNMAKEVEETLLRLVPKIRLMIAVTQGPENS